MLEIINLQKAFATQTILHCAALHLPKHIYWIRGDNGSGKTTFLKIIAGLLPFSGDVLCNGISQKKDAVRYRQQIGWAEAEPLYPPFLSGMELLKLYQQIRKAEPKAADQLVGLFCMESYIGNKIGTYSAGMCKKLSLALALMGQPALCVLDEPLITLDSSAVDSFCRYVAECHLQLGTTFLMSSHQQPEAVHFAASELHIQNRHINKTA